MKELKRLKKEIMVLGIPILIEQILTTTMGMMNTMLSSNLEGDVVIHVVSAISMIDSFSYLFISVFTSFAMGGERLWSHNMLGVTITQKQMRLRCKVLYQQPLFPFLL